MKINYDFPTNAYAKQIIDGEIIVCQMEKLLAKRHIKDLKRQDKKSFPYFFDESRADRFFKFYEHCINPDTLEPYILLPHMKFDEGLFYGWVCKDTGARRFTCVFDFQARGGAKSTRAGIRSAFAISNDKIYLPNQSESGFVVRNARVDLLAVDKQQVEEVREPLFNIVNQTPFLKKRINALTTKIVGTKYGGKINVLSSDASNKQGGKPDMINVDELSSFKNDKIIRDIDKGLGKKMQYSIFFTTTAGDNSEANPAKKEYEYSKKVLTGKIKDDRYLPIIREVEEKDDIHIFSNWQKACPMFRYLDWYPYSKNLYEKVISEYNRAFSEKNSEDIRHFLIYRMNQWQVKSADKYLEKSDINKLKECIVSEGDFKELTFGKDKIVGLDFSMRRDLTAVADVYNLGDKIAFDSTGFIIDDTVKDRIAKDNIGFGEWIDSGYIKTMDYDTVNQDVIGNFIVAKEKSNRNEIKEICYDPYKAYQLAINLEEGKYGDKEYSTVQIPQTSINLHIPTDKLRNLIREKKVIWNGNPALLWCFENCYLQYSRSGDLIRIAKENKDSHNRIDMVAAIINAMARIEMLKDNTLEQLIEEGRFEF